jgi:hypothetical protein
VRNIKEGFALLIGAQPRLISAPSWNPGAIGEYEEMMTWLGGKYDPVKFNPSQVKFDNPQKRWNNDFCVFAYSVPWQVMIRS